MTELRLLPTAVVTWLVVAAVILSHSWLISAGIVLVALIIAGVLRQWGQLLVLGTVSSGAWILTALRIKMAKDFQPPSQLIGEVAGVKLLESGDQLITLTVEGYPVPISVFYGGEDTLEPSSVIAVTGTTKPDSFPGVGDITVSAHEIELFAEASGYQAWVNHVRDEFAISVQQAVGESSQGLIPGMVLGDTRLQDEVETQTYIDTGLSHLSAVSGSNVAIVVSSVVVLSYFLTAGPRTRVLSSLMALGVFVSLVGFEPSVLRAAVTGVVGLLAIINSSRMEPMHGLSLAIIVLLFYDSDLAVHYGFLLSCAATAGIVMLYPLLYRPMGKALAVWKIPDLVVRALAVSIAADLVTIPIVALMARQVSLVAVLANVAVEAAVPPITLLGLIAVLLSLLPWPVEYPVLKLIEPFTWWIHHVASWCQKLPHSQVTLPNDYLSLIWVCVLVLWILIAINHGLIRLIIIGCGVFFGIQLLHAPLAERVDPSTLNFQVVEKEEDIAELVENTEGIELLIVEESTGRISTRPVVTPEGIPVLYPYRDGEVSLHVDGTQHAADGRF